MIGNLDHGDIAEVRTEILVDVSNPMLLVHVTTEDGWTGTGETWWGTYQPQSKAGSPVGPIESMTRDILAPLCIGRPAGDIAGLWQRLYRASYQYGPEGVTSSALAGIDLALWDLAGKRVGKPVAELLGPRAHQRLPAYASLHWIGETELVCREAQRAVDAGFGSVKLHEASADIVLAVRQQIGPDIGLMVDVSARLDDAGARQLATKTTAASLEWLEEPIFPQQDHARLAELRGDISQKLAAGENEFSLAGFRRLLESGAVDIVQPDLAKCGGLSVAVQIAELATRSGVQLCPHNFSLGPSLGANIHWAMTASAATRIEVPLLPEGQSFPGSYPMPTLVNGMISYPEVPGLAWT